MTPSVGISLAGRFGQWVSLKVVVSQFGGEMLWPPTRSSALSVEGSPCQ
jgi:hypothetical protein